MEGQKKDSNELGDIQAEVDRVLAGELEVKYVVEDRRPFTVFLPDDQREASDLTGQWMSIANRYGGIDGLAAAVSAISGSLGQYRPGLVEHATLMFLTHHPEARAQLLMRSLEERQPRLTASSIEYSRER